MKNIRHNLIIKANIDEVYQAITSEDGLKQWWTDSVTAKPIEGHVNHFRFEGDYSKKMKIIKLESPMIILWKCIDGDKEWIGTDISFELEQREQGVVLKFSHLNWKEESNFFGFCSHQWGRYLDSLKSLCETGLGKPYIKK